jgi:dsRNA-specific ribonuclease
LQLKNELGNPKNLLELQKASYERLEYFGDRVVKLVTSMYFSTDIQMKMKVL